MGSAQVKTFQETMDKGTKTLFGKRSAFGQAMGGVEHAFKQVSNVFVPPTDEGSGPDETVTQNYSMGSQTRKAAGAGGTKDPFLANKRDKTAIGKRKLYATKKQVA